MPLDQGFGLRLDAGSVPLPRSPTPCAPLSSQPMPPHGQSKLSQGSRPRPGAGPPSQGAPLLLSMPVTSAPAPRLPALPSTPLLAVRAPSYATRLDKGLLSSEPVVSPVLLQAALCPRTAMPSWCDCPGSTEDWLWMCPLEPDSLSPISLGSARGRRCDSGHVIPPLCTSAASPYAKWGP